MQHARRSPWVAAIGLLACLACRADDQAPAASRAPEPVRPRLVVVIVVDQMRADYIPRFEHEWHDGFSRLLSDGWVFTHFHHRHGMTETAPGHATLVTGTIPARHGIVANATRHPTQPTAVSIVADPDVRTLGQTTTGVSARPLLREGLGDWLQQRDPDAVVISISSKDRSGVLLGAKQPDLALWFAGGTFTTSSYYAQALPAWVRAYDAKARAAALFGGAWTLLRSPDAYRGSARLIDPHVQDAGACPLSVHFPHRIVSAAATPSDVVRWTPFADQMTLELAMQAIASEQMGVDEVPDLLLIGLSGGDYIGHRFGPDSLEMHDYYLRLDERLGEFLRFLDARLGDDPIVVLTSDHGVAPLPEQTTWPSAGRFEYRAEVSPIVASLAATRQIPTPGVGYSQGIDLYFDAGVDAPARAAFRGALAERLREHPMIADAWAFDELASGSAHGVHGAAWLMSFHPARSSDVLLEFERGVVDCSRGTGHGTPHDYDSHVPLIIAGSDRSGRTDTPAASFDLAPTLAELLGIPTPNDLDGTSLLSIDR